MNTMDKLRGDFLRPLPCASSIMPFLANVLSHPMRCETFSSLDLGPVLCNNDYVLFLRFHMMGYVYAFRVNILAKMTIVVHYHLLTLLRAHSPTSLCSAPPHFTPCDRCGDFGLTFTRKLLFTFRQI